MKELQINSKSVILAPMGHHNHMLTLWVWHLRMGHLSCLNKILFLFFWTFYSMNSKAKNEFQNCDNLITQIDKSIKVIHSKYSKYWPYTVAHTIDLIQLTIGHRIWLLTRLNMSKRSDIPTLFKHLLLRPTMGKF